MQMATAARRRRPSPRLLPLVLAFISAAGTCALGQLPALQNASGVRMEIETADRDPALRITIPDGPPDHRSFDILFPEHVTVRARNSTDAQHLYIFKPGTQGVAPHWKRSGQTLEYTTNFGQLRFTARATLVSDGIVFRYDFSNGSATGYDSVYAVTDPRFSTVFYDPRLERTYVHRSDGFDLLASETPQRLTLPLSQWFPVRYLAQYTAPIPAERVQHRTDGITYIYSSRPVDLPIIATLSADRTWVAASFSRDPGNVWTNPELTCQHVDPEVSLPHNAHASYELKILLFKGTLQDALQKVRAQRSSLEQTLARIPAHTPAQIPAER